VIAQLLKEIDDFAERMKEVERLLESLSAEDATVQRLQTIPGVGLIVSTALRAAVSDIHRFPSGRHLSCWLGLTAREHSSGERRRLGPITHGARSALFTARNTAAKGHELDRLRRWALETEKRVGHNKAVIALANKLGRIMWATWKNERAFELNWTRYTGRNEATV
jgi:transposase